MKFNLICLTVYTIVSRTVFTAFPQVPEWVQSHCLWDQAQWVGLEVVLLLLWFPWLIVTLAWYIRKRES